MREMQTRESFRDQVPAEQPYAKKAGRLLSQATQSENEHRYTQIEKEMLAVTYGLEKFLKKSTG
jgi:hypothetical protein